MANPKEYWNQSTSRLPDDKDPSSYATHIAGLLPPHATIADLGGGSGEDATLFATRGHDVTLLDINDIDIKKAEECAARFAVTPFVHTIQHDMSDGLLPLASETFDIVYSRLTLHFFNETTLASLLREVDRILKPGGKTFMTLKSPKDVEEMEFLRARAKELSPGLFNMNGMTRTRFTIEQLTSIAQNAGLKNKNIFVREYEENLGDRNDLVKSNVSHFLLNEIVITKV